MARPYWTGQISLSLVSFAVEVYPAVTSARPFQFHQIDRATGERIHYQNVAADGDEADDSGAERKRGGLHIAPKGHGAADHDEHKHVVEKSDIVKGYEYEKGKYAIIEPAELKNLRLAGKKTIEISQFAKACEIDPALYEKPYFVMPKPGPQAKAFHVVRQSMADRGMVGVGEIVFSGRQHLMTLAPPHDPKQPGMMLYTLRFANELRNAGDYATATENSEADAAQLNLAKQLIDAYTEQFEIAKFKDHYEEALRELVDAKLNNLPAPEPEVEKKAPKVIDLMEALRKSVAQRASSAGAPASAAAAVEPPRATDKKLAATGTAKTKAAGVTSRSGARKNPSLLSGCGGDLQWTNQLSLAMSMNDSMLAIWKQFLLRCSKM